MGIYVNQVGYMPNAAKVAISTFPCNFQLIRAADQQCIMDGTTTEAGFDHCSGETVYQIDFSSVTEPGTYYLLAGNLEKSHTFVIDRHVYRSLKNTLLKAFYYQRCGCALEEAHAGPYTHEACHTAPAIFLEDYQNKAECPQSFDMTGGWHDAGDFGRYTSAGAVALAHLLYAFELFPESFKEPVNIPESGNGIPDLLNECLYELEWMLKMQAPDGGAYHKLTSFCHADFVMPENDHSQFLIYPVSSMATADFAAVMALASRVYASCRPDFSRQALAAARKAYDWLEHNPYVGFHNPEGSNTGEYDDLCDLDERLWASAELLRTSDSGWDDPALQENYALLCRQRLNTLSTATVCKTDFGWTDVSGLASLTILFDPDHHALELEDAYRDILLREADRLISLQQESGYRLSMEPDDFVWGSNMVVCNRSILLILASLLTTDMQKNACQAAAFEQLHYLLGRNALDISYVTGFGENAYQNPHNRPTFADGIDLPMAGWVSGGPFKAPCDPQAIKMIPQGTAPMKCYVDHVESYSTNEITIYWNSPALFMTAFFDSL